MQNPEISTLELTPHGIVICRDSSKKELSDFSTSESAGLLRLAGRKLSFKPDGSVDYWKEFSALFLRTLCQSPEGEELTLPLPSPAEWAERVLNAPPMRGGAQCPADARRRISLPRGSFQPLETADRLDNKRSF